KFLAARPDVGTIMALSPVVIRLIIAPRPKREEKARETQTLLDAPAANLSVQIINKDTPTHLSAPRL
ncbi:MAG TPA: hypothetical protein VM866_01080, partial [Pyrinomonadaceae bacterium]|nr:hypothetical protein [Pyrinomonadaceae bacterium]